MATQTNTHPIMVQQYLHSFEGWPGLHDELINGRIVMTPDAKPRHQHVQRNIQTLLDAACAEPVHDGTRYIANGDSNIELTPFDMPSPDVFVVSWAAWRRAMKANEYLSVTPLLVVEILSPGQNIDEKLEVYLTARIDAVWVVDPKTRTVTVYGPDRSSVTLEHIIKLPFPLSGALKVADFFTGLPE